MRLSILFLRARLTGLALAWFGVAAILTWVWLTRFNVVPLGLTLVALPLLPAVVVGAAAHSPFGEVEEIASRPLPVYRVLHLLGLTASATVLLAGVASAVDADGLGLALGRTLVGFSGLALLGGRILGHRLAWLAPLAYAALALYLDPASRWAWPQQIPVERWSLFRVLLLGVLGLLAAALAPSRDQPDEQ